MENDCTENWYGKPTEVLASELAALQDAPEEKWKAYLQHLSKKAGYKVSWLIGPAPGYHTLPPLHVLRRTARDILLRLEPL